LGIDSEFAMIESVMTVIKDSGYAGDMSHPKLAAIVCGVSYMLGLIFITDAGIYWFNLFDYYSCVVVMFFVCGLECYGLMWAASGSAVIKFKSEVLTHTGITLPAWLTFLWKWVCPFVLMGISVLTFLDNPDLMGAEESQRFPMGSGYLPAWSIKLGWILGVSPLIVCFATMICPDGDIKRRFKDLSTNPLRKKETDSSEDSSSSDSS